jgi:hypothetical protein
MRTEPQRELQMHDLRWRLLGLTTDALRAVLDHREAPHHGLSARQHRCGPGIAAPRAHNDEQDAGQ